MDNDDEIPFEEEEEEEAVRALAEIPLRVQYEEWRSLQTNANFKGNLNKLNGSKPFDFFKWTLDNPVKNNGTDPKCTKAPQLALLLVISIDDAKLLLKSYRKFSKPLPTQE